jgi:hypothetical protein
MPRAIALPRARVSYSIGSLPARCPDARKAAFVISHCVECSEGPVVSGLPWPANYFKSGANMFN